MPPRKRIVLDWDTFKPPSNDIYNHSARNNTAREQSNAQNQNTQATPDAPAEQPAPVSNAQSTPSPAASDPNNQLPKVEATNSPKPPSQPQSEQDKENHQKRGTDAPQRDNLPKKVRIALDKFPSSPQDTPLAQSPKESTPAVEATQSDQLAGLVKPEVVTTAAPLSSQPPVPIDIQEESDFSDIEIVSETPASKRLADKNSSKKSGNAKQTAKPQGSKVKPPVPSVPAVLPAKPAASTTSTAGSIPAADEAAKPLEKEYAKKLYNVYSTCATSLEQLFKELGEEAANEQKSNRSLRPRKNFNLRDYMVEHYSIVGHSVEFRNYLKEIIEKVFSVKPASQKANPSQSNTASLPSEPSSVVNPSQNSDSDEDFLPPYSSDLHQKPSEVLTPNRARGIRNPTRSSSAAHELHSSPMHVTSSASEFTTNEPNSAISSEDSQAKARTQTTHGVQNTMRPPVTRTNTTAIQVAAAKQVRTQARTQPHAQPQSQSQTQTQSQPQPQPRPQAQNQSQAQPQSQVQTQSQTQSQSQNQAQVLATPPPSNAPSKTPIIAQKANTTTAPKPAPTAGRKVESTPAPTNNITSVNAHIKCLLPGKEGELDMELKPKYPLYQLESKFGKDFIISMDGKEMKRHSIPAYFAPDAAEISLIISNRSQFLDMQLGETPLSSQVAKPTATTASQAVSEDGDRFPITLNGKEGSVKVVVSKVSKLTDLINHYRTSHKIGANIRITLKFDGDPLDANDTIGDVEIEDGESIDVYTK